MASFNKKTYVITAKKRWRKKYKKYAIVFAITQLKITRLRKYPIDPKAYLGRCKPLVNTDSVPGRILDNKVNFEKSLQMTTKAWKINQHAKS